MSDTITLTRKQWNELFDGLDLIRDRFDEVCQISCALKVLGLDKPADTLDAAEDNLAQRIASLQAILIDADETKPSKLKIRMFGQWWWPYKSQSNKEA